MLTIVKYPTEEEARAFEAGVRYVNDSAIRVAAPQQHPWFDDWIVVIFDEDQPEDRIIEGREYFKET